MDSRHNSFTASSGRAFIHALDRLAIPTEYLSLRGRTPGSSQAIGAQLDLDHGPTSPEVLLTYGLTWRSPTMVKSGLPLPDDAAASPENVWIPVAPPGAVAV